MRYEKLTPEALVGLVWRREGAQREALMSHARSQGFHFDRELWLLVESEALEMGVIVITPRHCYYLG